MTPKELELLQQHPAFTQHMLGILTELDQAATGDEAEAALQRGFQRVAVCALRETLTPKSESKPFKGVQRDKKKITWFTLYGAVELEEQVWREFSTGKTIRPLKSLGITNRSYSGGLQRAMTDFGAERSFKRAAQALQEHYRITVPEAAVKDATLWHAHQCAPQVYPLAPARTPAVCELQTDGCMVPTVFFKGAQPDARCNRCIEWKELRLAWARATDRIQPTFGAVIGDATQAGNVWRQTASSQGVRDSTYCHGVGDGAPWIVDQFQKHFGGRGKYLLDLFHVCEKLGAVALLYQLPDAWLPRMKQHLVTGQASRVMTELYQRSEPDCLADESAPARVALRYLRQRWDHLHYREALSKNLSVGSGAIESGHRSVIQARLKIAGAWWSAAHAQAMAQLRVLRANQQWTVYWDSYCLKTRQL